MQSSIFEISRILKRKSLLLNKRIRKTEKHALHDTINTVDSIYGMHTQALTLHNSVLLCRKNSFVPVAIKVVIPFNLVL